MRASRRRRLDSGAGYAMAGLLVAVGIMGILMSVAMPPWLTVVKREKEAELLFRGRQYVRAIDLYQRRFPGAYPIDLDMLVEGRFLRRPYLDPMTGEPFQILRQGSAVAAGETASAAETADGRERSPFSDRTGRDPSDSLRPDLGRQSDGASRSPFSRDPAVGGEELGGIVGVVSRSSDDSLLEYNGATRYDQWFFVHGLQAAQPGVGGAPMPGGGIGVGGDGRAGIGGAGIGGATGLSPRPAGGDFGDGPFPGRGRSGTRGR